MSKAKAAGAADITQQTPTASNTASIIPQATDGPKYGLRPADAVAAPDALDVALGLAALGIGVFPVSRTSKRPVMPSPGNGLGGWHERIFKPDEIETMWTVTRPRSICGFVAKDAGLVVLDIDGAGPDTIERLGLEVPPTLGYPTNHGFHLLYRLRPGVDLADANPMKFNGVELIGLDRKGGNGYAVWRADWVPANLDEIAEAPAWMLQGNPPGVRGRQARTPGTKGAPADAVDWRELVKTFPTGKACIKARIYRDDVKKTDEADHITHKAAYDLAYRGFRLGHEGHQGMQKGLTILSELWAAYLDVERPEVAEAEVEAAFSDTAADAVAEGAGANECDCQPLTTTKKPDAERSGPGGFDVFLAEDDSPMDAKMGALVETLRARGDIELQQMLDGQVAIRNSSSGWSMAVDLYRVHYCRVKGGSKWRGKFNEAIRTLDPPLVAEKNAEPAEPEQLFGRRGSLTLASDIKMKRTRWLWEGRLPMGELALGGGREGTGKSTYAAWIAAQVTRGTLPGELLGTPRMVLYVGTEDSWETTIAPRMVAAGADMSLISRFDMTYTDKATGEVSDEVAVLPEDLDEFRRVIVENEVALVILDPLLDLVNIGLDTHKERDVRHALRPLVAVAHETDAAFYGLVHFNKGTGDVASLITGSGAFKNVARLVDAFAADSNESDGERVIQQVKNSLGPLLGESLGYRIVGVEVETEDGINRTSRFEFTGTAGRSVMEILDTNRRAPSDSDATPEAAAWLRAYLTAHGFTAPAGEVLAAGKSEAGFSPDQLRRAQDRIPGYLVAARRVSDGATGAGHWIWEMRESAT